MSATARNLREERFRFAELKRQQIERNKIKDCYLEQFDDLPVEVLEYMSGETKHELLSQIFRFANSNNTTNLGDEVDNLVTKTKQHYAKQLADAEVLSE